MGVREMVHTAFGGIYLQAVEVPKTYKHRYRNKAKVERVVKQEAIEWPVVYDTAWKTRVIDETNDNFTDSGSIYISPRLLNDRGTGVLD